MMNIFKRYILAMVMIVLANFAMATTHTQSAYTHSELKSQATEFFNAYINTYNKRFGHPEKATEFISELSQLINQPFIMAPPNNTPFYPDTPVKMSRSFNGFIQMLEDKGAVKLSWKELKLHVLTQNKILANNLGQGINAKGEVVYETISIYLIYRDEGQWKIVMFSPYDINNKLTF